MLTLQDIYNYIFRPDWANPEFNLPSTLTPEEKQLQIKKRQAKMKALFSEAIIPEDKERFRSVLRELKATHLETALYGNTTDTIKEEDPTIICYEEKFCHETFLEMDQSYRYFSAAEDKEIKDSKDPTKTTEAARKKYTLFFQVSKIIADFIERNNDENQGPPIYHAYILLVIFGDQDKSDRYFKSIDAYLKNHNYLQSDHPLHDALLWNISAYQSSLHLPEWRKIIYETGTKALQLFARAADIDAKLGTAPKSYLEALKVARTITYERVDEFPKLAELAIHYNLSETNFNKALEVQQRVKKTDNLPTIVIRGEDIGIPRYYLIKLPPGDHRAYVLGYITNCCQSMGGDSEACVIDGITRPNNGFLVLLKERLHAPETKEQKSTRRILTDSDLDIQHLLNTCKIVGQGYFWRSLMGNLTIDSWENLNPKAEDAIAVKMLRQYAADVIHVKNNEIARVTIGQGGKTPAEVKQKIKNREIMLEGAQYGDSYEQRLIAFNEKFRKETFQQLKTFFTTLNETVFKEITTPETMYSFAIRNALRIPSLQDFLKKPDNQKTLAIITKIRGCNIWNAFNFMEEAKLCTLANLERAFLLGAQTLAMLAEILWCFKKANALDQEVFDILSSDKYRKQMDSDDPASNRNKILNLFYVLSTFADLNILNKTTFDMIVTDLEYLQNYATAITNFTANKMTINTRMLAFIYTYPRDSTTARLTLDSLLGSQAPDIYRHFNHKLKRDSKLPSNASTINYSDMLSYDKNFKKSEMLFGAVCILVALLANPEDLHFYGILTGLTRAGNLPIIEELLKRMPEEYTLDNLFTDDMAIDYLVRHAFKNSQRGFKNLTPLVEKSLTDKTLLLLCAALCNHSEVADFYIKLGADINAALFLAVFDKQTESVAMLLTEKKADPNYILTKDDELLSTGNSALHYAIRTKNSAVINLLIEQRANVNAVNKDGISPLHEAISINNPDTLELLIAQRADIKEIYKHSGIPPLSYALEKENISIATIQELLLMPEIKFTLNSFEDLSQFYEWKNCKNAEVKKFLQEYHAQIKTTKTTSAVSFLVDTLTHPIHKRKTSETSDATQEVKDKKTPDAKV